MQWMQAMCDLLLAKASNVLTKVGRIVIANSELNSSHSDDDGMRRTAPTG